MIIRAELTGSDTCTAEGITVTGHAPVLALCRKLIEAGYNPAAELKCYRGKTLCITIRPISEGAKLRITTSVSGRPVFDKYKGEETTAAASPIKKSSEAAE